MTEGLGNILYSARQESSSKGYVGPVYIKTQAAVCMKS